MIINVWIVGIDIWRELRPGQISYSGRTGTSRPRSTENGSDVSRTQVRRYATAASW